VNTTAVGKIDSEPINFRRHHLRGREISVRSDWRTGTAMPHAIRSEPHRYLEAAPAPGPSGSREFRKFCGSTSLYLPQVSDGVVAILERPVVRDLWLRQFGR
jgi:hypothetical protein